MKEQELMEKIKLSAEEIKIPEGLSPESMKKKLETAKAAGTGDVSRDKKKHWHTGRKIIAAAAILLVCGTGVFAVCRAAGGNMGDRFSSNADMDLADESRIDENFVMAEGADAADNTETEDAAGEKEENAMVHKKSSAGDLYVVAENYGEIYDIIKENVRSQTRYGDVKAEMAAGGAAMEESAADGSGIVDFVSVENAAAADTVKSGSYSTTNLQMEGVDESDIIKTDGSYIYVVSGNIVKMIDIQNAKMKETGEIDISGNSASDRVMEMYVDGNKLNLILEREETQLGQSAAEEADQSAVPGNDSNDDTTYVINDVYYMDSKTVTELQTYDITDRKNPILEGSVTQDGAYKNSRKIGRTVYLFTQEYMQMPALAREQAVMEGNAKGWIPLVNGTAITADCIYLPEQGSCGLIVSSINVDKPDKVVDNTLIINNYVNIYVSTESLYLYGTNYTDGGVTTQIAKFSLNEGVIDAVGAVSAAGEVYDTFAINEYEGKLRLLTTDWSGSENENNLYLFDKNLKLTGSLTGIAEGEQIYAARYFGDTAYFVTYRNMDPLFAVDLSDEKNPEILSELEITGFSEYLHFWGKDKLVGIGYETDPDTGSQEGIKLTMFDISDPSNLKTLGTCVIENIYYSPALYNYKCVLADAGENLIGFAAESCGGNYESSYLLFSWENGKFKELMTQSVSWDVGTQSYRGLYVGDTFYIVSSNSVASYDREDGYKMLEMLEL